MLFFWKKKTKSLNDHLNETKVLNIRGVHFKVKRLGVIDHLNGSKVLTENFHLYSNPNVGKGNIQPALEALKKHYRDVFMACVNEPTLSRKKDCPMGETFVDNLFLDMDIAHDLYMEIMIYTHGKKKVKESLTNFR